VVVPNGVGPVPTAVASTASPERDGLPCGPVVVGVGRLEATKGFDLLVEAFSEVGDDLGATLVLAGDGSQRERLRTLGHKTDEHPAYKGALKLLNNIYRKEKLAQRFAVLQSAAWLLDILEKMASTR